MNKLSQWFEAMSRRTTFLFGNATGLLTALLVVAILPKKTALAVLAGLALFFGAAGTVSWVDDVHDAAKTSDVAEDGVVTKARPAPAKPTQQKEKGGFLLPGQNGEPVKGKLARTSATEHGVWAVAHVRPCRDGQWNITELPQYQRTFVEEAFPSEVCGVIYAQDEMNFLADEGESNIVDCVYRSTNCPTAFTMSLLSTAASPAETSTWAALSSSELVTGTSPGYAAAAITRDSTGWPTLDTVASGTGGCTESSCARVSTAQVVITASGNWTVAARYITIRGTVSAAQRHFATAQLTADRQLQNGDQLNITYRQAMQ